MAATSQFERKGTIEGTRIPMLSQRWRDLVFLHRAAEPAEMLPFVPNGLTLDTFPNDCGEQRAWIGLIAFRIEASRAFRLLPLPWFGEFAELNVRSYVRGSDGEPAVLFLSLDAPRRLTNAFARETFGVPYRLARARLVRTGNTLRFDAERFGRSPAKTKLVCELGLRCGAPSPGSLDHFLVERYRYYAAPNGRLFTGQVRHEPYSLASVRIHTLESSHAESLGLPSGEWEHARYCEGVDSLFFAPRRLGRVR